MINYFLTKNHFYTIEPFINSWSKNGAELFRMVPYETIDQINFIDNDIFIFTDLERISESTLDQTRKLCRVIEEKFSSQHILNHPGVTLGRLELLDLLWQKGINDYRVYPVATLDHSCRFPIFLRRPNNHLGPLTSLLHNEEEYHSALAKLAKKGILPEELIAIEYCETVDRDGGYRKYSAFRVGTDIIPGHIHFAQDWFVKGGKHGAPRDEEKNYLEKNPHRTELMEVFQLAEVDFGRIDYSMKNGKIQVWEINTNPTLLRHPEKYHPVMKQQKAALAEKIEQSFLSLARTLNSGKQPDAAIEENDINTNKKFPAMHVNGWKRHYHYSRFFIRRYLEALMQKFEKV